MFPRSSGVVLLVVIVAGAAMTGGVAGESAQTESIEANPVFAGATATHTVKTTAGSPSNGEPLAAVRVDYQGSHAFLGNVSGEDVQRAGVDTNGDGRIDVGLQSDIEAVAAQKQGRVLLVEFSGAHTLAAGDMIVLSFGDVRNPPQRNTYGIGFTINPGSTQVVEDRGLLTIQPPAASVTGYDIEQRVISTGESVSVTATVTNWATTEQSQDVTLFVDDQAVARRTVTVPGGGSETVTFTTNFSVAGNYSVTVNELAPTTVSVSTEPTTDVVLDDYRVSREVVPVSTPVSVTANVTNTGNVSGSLDVTLVVDGAAVQTRTVTVPANDATSVTFTTSFESASAHTVSVNDKPATTITVVDPPLSFEVAQYDADGNGDIGLSEVQTAISDWRTDSGVDPSIDLLQDIISAWAA